MARKVVSRKALREEVEAAERAESEGKKPEEKKAAKAEGAQTEKPTAEAKVVRVNCSGT